MDRLTSMEALVRVVDAGSFAEAARRWGRSTSVVSKYVSQLEEDLGVRLLRRTTRRLGLTDAGVAHVERCRRVLADVTDAEAQLRADHAELRGGLRISAPPGFLGRHRRRAVTDFVLRYPEVRLDIDLTHRMVDLVEEHVDVAIRLTRPEDSSLVARRLGPAPLVLLASPAYLAAAGRPAHPSELGAHACIADTNFTFHPRWPFVVDGRPVAVEIGGPVQVNSPSFVRGLALDGLGLALIPRMLVEDDLERGDLEELFPGAVDAGWSIWAVTSQRRLLNARTRAFIGHLREVLGDPA
ncbi:MAG: LysR family transcriptional regulator [Sandaracinaceae bacterium]